MYNNLAHDRLTFTCRYLPTHQNSAHKHTNADKQSNNPTKPKQVETHKTNKQASQPVPSPSILGNHQTHDPALHIRHAENKDRSEKSHRTSVKHRRPLYPRIQNQKHIITSPCHAEAVAFLPSYGLSIRVQSK